MQKILSAEEMREVDRQTTEKYGIPSIILMENAAHAAANVIKEKLGGSVAGKSFLILCGKGNNGGDGAALARILLAQNARVTVLIFGKIIDTQGDANLNFQILHKISLDNNFLDLIECEKTEIKEKFHQTFFRGTLKPFDCLVDALFGTGLTRPLDENFNYVIEIINQKQLWKQRRDLYLIVSIDIPSGLNANSAELIGKNIHADITVTFTAPKIANVMSPSSKFNGELFVADIGSRSLIRKIEVRNYVILPDGVRGFLCETQVQKDSYKKTRGTCLIIAGSDDFSGAAVLAANACFAAGAGMVSVAVAKAIKPIVAAKTSDEIIVKTLEKTEIKNEKVDVIAIGCGLEIEGRSPRVSKGGQASESNPSLLTRELLLEIVENRNAPMVLDAEALNALSPFDLQGSDEFPLILTPHIGEFKRLLGREIGENKIEETREFAEKHNVILVLKGERSLIAAPDGKIIINPTGNAGISRAGSGDTLTGIITSFIAQTLAAKKSEKDETNLDKILQAVIAALYVAGKAGDIAAAKFSQRFMTATDIRHCLAQAVCEIDDRESKII